MKKHIKIKFVDFFDDFDPFDNDFISILNSRYDVEISDNPDYIFYSTFGDKHLNYNCIRIFYTGECVTPDFNVCDYAIGFDRLLFGDRYIRVPLYMLFQYKDVFLSLNKKNTFALSDLDSKKGFCSFVYSNCFADDYRTKIFELLSDYKKVDSGGRYKNNIGGAVKDKREFQSHYKFSVAFENTSYNGYCTEKLVEAFAADTIPIYFGDPQVAEDFNEEAFINCHRYKNLESVVDAVKEIDQNNDLYLKIKNTNPAVIKYQSLDGFLFNIFDQEINSAVRRNHSIQSLSREKMIKRHRFFENIIYKYYAKIKRQFIRYKTGTFLFNHRGK